MIFEIGAGSVTIEELGRIIILIGVYNNIDRHWGIKPVFTNSLFLRPT